MPNMLAEVFQSSAVFILPFPILTPIYNHFLFVHLFKMERKAKCKQMQKRASKAFSLQPQKVSDDEQQRVVQSSYNGMLIRWGWPGKLGTCYPHEIPQVPSGSKTLPSYYISINDLKIIWTCSTYNSNLRKMDRCFLQTYSETTMKYSQNIIATGNIFSGCLMEPS